MRESSSKVKAIREINVKKIEKDSGIKADE